MRVTRDKVRKWYVREGQGENRDLRNSDTAKGLKCDVP